MNIKKLITDCITSLLRDNLTIKNEHEETIKGQEKKRTVMKFNYFFNSLYLLTN